MKKKLLQNRPLILLLFICLVFNTRAENAENEIKTLLEVNQQKDKTITGRIYDSNNEPIIGANIVEKGTSNGTVTDNNGDYTLNVGNDALLRVTYIGYLEQEVSTKNRTTINVVLIEIWVS